MTDQLKSMWHGIDKRHAAKINQIETEEFYERLYAEKEAAKKKERDKKEKALEDFIKYHQHGPLKHNPFEELKRLA